MSLSIDDLRVLVKEALDWYAKAVPWHNEHSDTMAAAARSWLKFPTPDQIEAVALVIHNKSPKCYEAFGDLDDGCACMVKAEAALLSVKETD